MVLMWQLQTHDGVTALMTAVAGGHEAVATPLLDRGAAVAGASHDDFTVLMLAADEHPWLCRCWRRGPRGR